MGTFSRWWRGHSTARKWFIGFAYVADGVAFVVLLAFGAYLLAGVLVVGTLGQAAIAVWGFARWGEAGRPPQS